MDNLTALAAGQVEWRSLLKAFLQKVKKIKKWAGAPISSTLLHEMLHSVIRYGVTDICVAHGAANIYENMTPIRKNHFEISILFTQFTAKIKSMKKVFFMITLFFALGMQANAQDSTLNHYVGRYTFSAQDPVPFVDVKLVDNVLMTESPSGNSVLQRTEGDTFFIVEFNGIALFVRNENNKVVKVKVSVQGLDMEGTKEESAQAGIQWIPYSIGLLHWN
jgi:hypothetical protein